MIFVGWRLADFTTAGDPYRANLERLFRNLLQLPGQAQRQSRPHDSPPPGESRYVRLLGVPLLRAANAVCREQSGHRGRDARRRADPATGRRLFSGRRRPFARNCRLAGRAVERRSLGRHALGTAQRPVSQYVALRKAEQTAVSTSTTRD